MHDGCNCRIAARTEALGGIRVKKLLALLLTLCLPAAALAADYCECPDEQAHVARYEEFVDILEDYDTMGAAIALIRDGRIVDTFYYGKANRADDIPVTSDTYFRVASISKMVSAIGILQMAEHKKITLDQDISDYFPYEIRNPRYPDTIITLRQIMSHTASFDDDADYKRATNGQILALSEVFGPERAKNNFLSWEPGTKSVYSNFGGGILGSLMETISGLTIDGYMTANVFGPVGIAAGYHTPNLPQGAQIARIYNTETNSMKLDLMTSTDQHWEADPETAYVHSAGALCMTAEGLAKLMIAVAGDGSVDGVRLLQPETVNVMRSRQDNIGSVRCDSGRALCLNIVKDGLVKGRTLFGHQGKAYGMICAAYFDPVDQTGVVLLTNGCDNSTFNSVARIARAVMARAYAYFE